LFERARRMRRTPIYFLPRSSGCLGASRAVEVEPVSRQIGWRLRRRRLASNRKLKCRPQWLKRFPSRRPLRVTNCRSLRRGSRQAAWHFPRSLQNPRQSLSLRRRSVSQGKPASPASWSESCRSPSLESPSNRFQRSHPSRFAVRLERLNLRFDSRPGSGADLRLEALLRLRSCSIGVQMHCQTAGAHVRELSEVGHQILIQESS
jgi:hypothetical protein